MSRRLRRGVLAKTAGVGLSLARRAVALVREVLDLLSRRCTRNCRTALPLAELRHRGRALRDLEERLEDLERAVEDAAGLSDEEEDEEEGTLSEGERDFWEGPPSRRREVL